MQLSLEAADGGGIELGVQLIAEMKRSDWVSSAIVVNALEEIVDSLEELAVDSPKIVEAASVFLAKLVEYKVITTGIIELLANKKQVAENNNKKQDIVS